MYYDDFRIGDKFTTPRKTVTEAMINIMVGLGGFVAPLFNDAEYARTTSFGSCIAPGRMTLFLMGGLEEQIGIYEESLVALVGLDGVKFKGPLRAGDTIRVELEIVAVRETSRPESGLVTHKSRCFNQRDELIVEAEASHLLKKRPS